MKAGATAFVAPMMRRELAKVQAAQVARWTARHSRCTHPRSSADQITCDHAEAHRTAGTEMEAYRQRAAWRASKPRVRHDSTRLVRDHHFALEMDKKR